MSTFPTLSPCKRSLDMQAQKTWCLHGSVISLQFAPCRSSLSSDPGSRDRLLSRNLLRLPVKEPLLAGLEHSSLLACGQKGCSCADTLPSMFAHFHTGGPTADPTTVNIFSPLMWHVCCVVALRCAAHRLPNRCHSNGRRDRLCCNSLGEKRLIKNVARSYRNEFSSANGIPSN